MARPRLRSRQHYRGRLRGVRGRIRASHSAGGTGTCLHAVVVVAENRGEALMEFPARGAARRDRINTFGRMAETIVAQQDNHPEYMQDELRAIVKGELKQLELETLQYWGAMTS